MLHNFYKLFRVLKNKSESYLATEAGISRLTLRKIEGGKGNPTIGTLTTLAESLGCKLITILAPENDFSSDCSTVAVSYKIHRDGFESWPLHLMECVDTFRKNLDMRLILLPPVSFLDPKLKALMASTVRALSDEAQTEAPEWARKTYFLNAPWFVSGMESLKATALVESPLPFRRNNIFVQSNFLSRR